MAGAGSGSDIGLADVIRQVREDLEEAQRDGAAGGHELRFAVDRVSLEIAVQVRREGRGGAGLRIGVVTADLGGAVSRETTHRIQVDLLPQGSRGTYHVGGEPGGRR
ncbi:trypco2 family protein [Streptomyces litchfieldiae]|uniref:Trypco2 family protein n=1 Tax=Streptomyces litchfieldiae TaxID=3075543 RepID=A0ABU2MJ77_9ACTN|nr:trypco2 family protein [Streptomyces sp. DSM 44938]MDT0341535.1 trypco2 family protein [Streptomyces sp. DSM 44938]